MILHKTQSNCTQHTHCCQRSCCLRTKTLSWNLNLQVDCSAIEQANKCHTTVQGHTGGHATHPLVTPNCVDCDIRWTFKSWEVRIYLWCLILRNKTEFVISEKKFPLLHWYSPLYWVGNSQMKENSGVLTQLDLLEIMPCIICTCSKFDPSLGHQSGVSLECNITLGRVSRILSFVFKTLQSMLRVYHISCCIWHYGKHFAAGLSNSLKTLSLKLSVWGGR